MTNLESDLFEGKCYDFDCDYAIFTDCKMLVDFGPVKKGSVWNTIQISFQNHRVIEFIDDSGKVIHTVPYKLVSTI